MMTSSDGKPTQRGCCQRQRRFVLPIIANVAFTPGGVDLASIVPLLLPCLRCLGLADPGVRREDVSRLMGHSSVRVTHDIYIHVSSDIYDRFYDATQ